MPMDAIVNVTPDWGIGRENALLVSISADLRRFRALTAGKTLILGRKTLADFPGGNPLPKRVNVLLTRGNPDRTDVIVCHSPEEALKVAQSAPKVMVIGGGSVYRQMLPYCTHADVTKVHASPESDTFFPKLDGNPQWELERVLQSGEEAGVAYEMCLYRRKGNVLADHGSDI